MPNPRGRGIPDQEPRRPIRARWLNRVKNLSEAAAAPILGPGLRGSTIAGQTLIRAMDAGVKLAWAKSPATDVDPGDSGTFELYGVGADDETLSGVTVTAYNRYAAVEAVIPADTTDVVLAYFGGRWYALTWTGCGA